MTLTELLKQTKGTNGVYEWRVLVYRADTLAVENLRVRLKIYRVKRWMGLPIGQNEVYSKTETCSRKRVDDVWSEMMEKAKRIAGRFEDERQQAEELPVSDG